MDKLLYFNKMKSHEHSKLLKTRGVLFILVIFLAKGVLGSRIELQNGGYKNILVAIDPTESNSNCAAIIQRFQEIFSEASAKLYTATESKVYFNGVRILIPSGWNKALCNVSDPFQANALDSYDAADVKLAVRHPLAQSLPWTSQFRGCGQSADEIFLPSEFLLSSSFNTSVRAQLFLHEWMKFRYGIFEEFGYYNDNTYPACYKEKSSGKLTSCSDISLETIGTGSSGSCRSDIVTNMEVLLRQLQSSSSSIMSMPHIESITKFCQKDNHNVLAPTKQNVLCNRQSTAEVLNSHSDFVGMKQSLVNQALTPTKFEIIQQSAAEYDPGYAFLIEDTSAIRQEFRLMQVKQSIAQMVDLMATGTRTAIWTFSGQVVTKPNPSLFNIRNDEDKRNFMSVIPDPLSRPIAAKLNTTFLIKQSEGNNHLGVLFQDVMPTLKTYGLFKWNIFLITSSPSESFEAARNLIHDSDHSISIFTFENNNPAWLQFYTTPNTQNVLVLPACYANGNVCSSKPQSLMVNAFVESLRKQDSPRYFQKVLEADISGGDTTEVVVDGSTSGSTNSEFYLYLSLQTGNSDRISVTSPSGTLCEMSTLLNYEQVYGINSTNVGCQYQAGTWIIDLTSIPISNTKYAIQGYLEDEKDIKIRVSMGNSANIGINPSLQLPSVFVRITNAKLRPIIDAFVEVSIVSSSLSADEPRHPVKDDGVDPDIIKNDGIYSAYLQHFSLSPSFHTGQVVIKYGDKTSTVTSVNTTEFGAALLDPELSVKCCGSVVPLGITSLLGGNAVFTALIPGFRTISDFDANLIPPAKIGTVEITEDEGTRLRIEFIAPGSRLNDGKVDHYDSCCFVTPSEEALQDPLCIPLDSSSDCIPVEAGDVQKCLLDRRKLFNSYLQGLPPIQDETFALLCSVRGVNALNVSGAESNNLVEIVITEDSLTGNDKSLKCESLSDKCLPMVVFWGLIGCIGGLVLVVLALVICWCCSSRNKKGDSSKKEVLMTMNRDSRNMQSQSELQSPGQESPQYNVYVNKAYIQDTDGQVKLVATDGELLPFDAERSNNNNTSQGQLPIPSVRRRSISALDYNNQNGRYSGERIPFPPEVTDDMKIYKSHNTNRPEPPQKPLSNPFLRPSMSEEDLTPVAKNRGPKLGTGYANSNINALGKVPLPSLASRGQGQTQEPNSIIYATVSRAGTRRANPTPPTTPLPMQPLTTFMNHSSPSYRPESKTNDPYKDSLVQNRFNRPVSTGGQSAAVSRDSQSRPVSYASQIQNEPSTRSTSLLRLDAFPSSDSDSYSDMSRGIPVIPNPPPVPPPFPKNPPNYESFIRNLPHRKNIQPKPTVRSPPKENGFHPSVPPLPSRPTTTSNVNQINNHYNSRNYDGESDDNSDYWDDEDFDFNPPGDSYA